MGQTLAWGQTSEPAGIAGTYAPVSVQYKNATLSASEFTALTSTCSFIQGDGTGFGIQASPAAPAHWRRQQVEVGAVITESKNLSRLRAGHFSGK